MFHFQKNKLCHKYSKIILTPNRSLCWGTHVRPTSFFKISWWIGIRLALPASSFTTFIQSWFFNTFKLLILFFFSDKTADLLSFFFCLLGLFFLVDTVFFARVLTPSFLKKRKKQRLACLLINAMFSLIKTYCLPKCPSKGPMHTPEGPRDPQSKLQG